MGGLTFKDLFLTTNKGIPDISNLPDSTTMARQYYYCSLILQCTIMLLFLFYFVLSIYRVMKKIKNHRFLEIPQQPKREQEEQEKTEVDLVNEHEIEKQNELEQNNNLIYRFDEDEDENQEKKNHDHEAEVKSDNGEGEQKMKEESNKSQKEEKSDKDEKEDKEDKEESKSVESNYNDYHDQNEESFIDLDDKLLFMQPFLISFIICNNLFAADYVGLIALVLMLVSYFLFNIKGIWGSVKVMPLLFMGFSVIGFLPFFISDHDVTT